MEGWYCIFECASHQWLMEGDWRMNDRDYQTRAVGTRHRIQTQVSSYNTSGFEMDIIDTEVTQVLVDGGVRVTPNTIMKWKTIGEAEKWLMNHTKNDGDFYSIRKIYF